ncbi:MAG: caspase family protein [Candidatus Solibacter sp.]|nr:caspase family protein [Candidatus Solibacter sp.]
MLRIALPGCLCRRLLALAGLLSLAATIPAVHAQEGGKRVALIIGNDAYATSPLKNAVNDARAIDSALRASNFRTILVENAKKSDMESKIGEFLDMLGPDDTALFFYAGHGVQIANENFLVPVDFVPGNSISSAKFSCMSVAQIFDELNRKRAKRNIIILDACRSNPVAEKYSLEGGLAQPQNSGKETYIAFSTGPGQVAADNPDGRNSWFTEALSEYVKQPSLTIELNEVFNKVKKRVSDATEGRQTPWTISSLTGGFYFHPPLNQDTENDPTVAEKWFDDAQRREQREDWAEAIDLINQILKKKPGGNLEEAARNKLPYLTARKEAQERFEAGDYAAAALRYEQAVKLDPFSIDAAFQGVNSYLLNDRVPDAIGLLKAIRIRGTSASTKKANAVLQELSAVSKEAGTELQSGIPQPPPIEEIFSGAHFGVPDWDAGARRLQTAPVDLSKWTKDLNLAEPAPIQVAQPAGQPVVSSVPGPLVPPGSAINDAVFHVELLPAGDKRDLKLRRVGGAPVLNSSNVRRPSGVTVKVTTEPPGAELTIDGDAEQHCQSPCLLTLAPAKQMVHIQLDGFRKENRQVDVKPGGAELAVVLEQEFGFVEFKGSQGETPIVYDGRQVAPQVPATVRVPVGKYEIRTMQDGKVLNRQDVEVTPLSKNVVTVKKP